MSSKATINIKNLYFSVISASDALEKTAPLPRQAKNDFSEVPQVGQPWPEQGGVLAGIMPAQEGHPAYYLIVPTDSETEAESLAWGNRGHEYEGMSSWDGKSNTEQLTGLGKSHPAAEFCVNLKINGFNDFYLPARREAALMAATVPELFKSGWHWTSSQSAALVAFVQGFAVGCQYDFDKGLKYRVRAVRRVIIESEKI